MTLQEVANFLIDRPGYLKWGEYRLAERLNVEPSIVNRAIEAIKFNNYEELVKDIPKILFLDIETSPILAYVWKAWKTNVYPHQLQTDWFILSWAAKWLGDSEAFGEVLTSEEAVDEDDYRIIQKLWRVLEEADIVITHNGDKFDIKKINTRFILHGLGPVSNYKSIDTLKVVRKHFAFTYNSLNEVAKLFSINGKLDTNFELWRKCLLGNNIALTSMLKYNLQDVLILEEVYYRLRPWINNHPNLGLYMVDTEHRCTNCHSPFIEQIGVVTSGVGKFYSYRCNSCGAISKSRKSILTRKQNKNLLTNG